MSVSVTNSNNLSLSVTVNGSTAASVTTTSPSVSVTQAVAPAAVSVSGKGPKGDTGADGADGQGLITGGSENQFIQKNSATDYDTKWSAYTLPAADGADGQVLTTDGAGSVTFTSLSASDVVNDLTPQLGGNLDVQTFNLFTSATNGDIQFTPQGTGSINLDGTVKFKRFTSAPTAFEGGMYADSNDNLYFGVS